MFIGEYQHHLDDKGRLALPVKFRNELVEGAIVTRGLDNCLFVFSKSSWLELAEKLAKLPLGQGNSRAFSRLMLAGAMDVSLDKQGRIVVPDYLRKYAGLNKTVVVAGLYNRLEIWSEETWNNYKDLTEKDALKIAEAMGELGV